MPDTLASLDFLIKTFMRPNCLRRLVDSILDRYPEAHLNIADDSDPDEETLRYYSELEAEGHQVLLLPFNTGISAGRNALVAQTARPFVLLLDDDYVFTDRTRIETMLDVMLADQSLGVVGGSVLDLGTDLNAYEFELRIEGRLGHSYPSTGTPRLIGGHPCRDTQIVHNFALFRREVFCDTRWDEALKTSEHTDFYLRLAPTAWTVVHVPEVSVDHFPERPEKYLPFRHNKVSDLLLHEKWRVAGWVYHHPDPVHDRWRVRRVYARAAVSALRHGKLVTAGGVAASAAANEVRRVARRRGRREVG